MHIDHSKLVELLAEASGIEKEKVEKQLAELAGEINQAIKDGDAYELENFGVFSGIGNNLIFIPADDLETEINYKYVGMEPIEMETAAENDVDAPAANEAADQPIADDTVDEEEEFDDPFGGLIDDSVDESENDADDSITDSLYEENGAEPAEEDSLPAETESSGDNKTEDDFVDDFIFGDAESTEDDAVDESEPDGIDEEQIIAETEAVADDDFNLDDYFSDSVSDAGSDSENEEEELLPSEQPGPDSWGIDSYKDDDDANMFSGLLGESADEEKDESEDDVESLFGDEDESEEIGKSENSEQNDAEELSIKLDTESSEETDEDEFGEDFDDPFKGFGEEDEEDEEDELEENAAEEQDEEEIIPVITNISSDTANKESAEQDFVAKPARNRQNPPIFLWLILALIVVAGGVFGLGYFGVINIPGISGQVATNQNPQPTTVPPANPAEDENTGQPANEATNQEPEATSDVQPTDVPADNVNNVQNENEVPTTAPDQPLYGLMGTAVSAANNGYTIVIFSLSEKSNADRQERLLTEAGYRTIISALPSSQYGTLWRVSIGQFRTMRDAALAAENLSEPYSQSYFITEI